MSFAWQVQGILHVAESEQNVKVVWHFELQPPLHCTTLHYTPLHSTTLDRNYKYNYNHNSQQYPHEAGRKLPQGYTIRPFSSIELACAVRQPGPCVCALHEAVAVLLSKNMTCARPRCNATPSEDFLRTSHCTLHTPHFTLHTSSHLKSRELFSPHLSSSRLIPSLLTCHRSKFFSTVFISSEHWSTFLISSKFVSTPQLLCTPESSYCQ